MDPVTQGALGAALAQSAARPEETRIAAAIGALAGLLADADILIRSSADPLLTLEYHRHFTHSIFFAPLAALLASLLAWPLLRSRLRFRRLYLFALLGYGLSGVLDACTGYGTRLLWPLSDQRVAWNLIAVVDPVFTLALLAAVIFALVTRRPRAAGAGLVFAGLYLSLGWVQQQRAEAVIEDLADRRGHRIERVLARPTLGNQVLWRTVYETGDDFHVDAVRVGLGPARVYPGGAAKRVRPERDLAGLPPGSAGFRDALRFEAFCDGFTIRHPERPDVIGDVRYSMTPQGLTPLWGIEIDPERPQAHARYRVFRELPKEGRQRFWSMILGRDLGPIEP
jgi:inner membrane protein